MRNLSHDCNQASNLIQDLQEKYDEQELLMIKKREWRRIIPMERKTCISMLGFDVRRGNPTKMAREP
jgi:ABC-type sulfate transport system substrate-binding protein